MVPNSFCPFFAMAIRPGLEPVPQGCPCRGSTSYNHHEEALITRTPSSAKQMAALGSIGSAVVLVGLKVFLAAATGSLGVLSEALHSGLDLIAAILTWLSVRVSDRPADSGHTYGHGKIESFSAFVETGLLLV